MGQWVGDRETALIRTLADLQPGQSVLDVGCGTGYFSRRLAQEEKLEVTGLDVDHDALHHAKTLAPHLSWTHGRAQQLPFTNHSFDHITAITSLPFMDNPDQVLRECTRVARHSILLGLFNRHSLLYTQRHRLRSYQKARWYTPQEITKQVEVALGPHPNWQVGAMSSALFLTQPWTWGRWLERPIPDRLLWGGFLLVKLIPVQECH
ncbi:class I SAM-dependent methyltransferase [Magnetococcus sp. PR-3]|uniref:class I SAM-dependent methyltransferase n=1 Tax=Magnetococcus sp. PR-3 TaxID=3120355 RepID=UPI002FCDE58F